MFEEFANQYGAQIIYMIISAILAAVGTFVGYVANRIRKKYEDNINSGEKKTLIDYCVQYAEQCCTGHGEEKYEFALSAATALLNEKGIPFSETELKIMIESAVASFNDAFFSGKTPERENRIGYIVEKESEEQTNG